MTQNIDLEFVKDQVNRLADGMSVNKEALARNVKALCVETANWRAAHARQKPSPAKSAAQPPFSETFGEMFGDK